MVNKKVTKVREHSRKVPVSKKNPQGRTVVDEHERRTPGTYLDKDEIEKIIKNYDRKSIVYPTSGKLPKYATADHYDELLAIWTDFFNKKFPSSQVLDPDVVKALLGSESSFQLNPVNPIAFGIAQITRETFKALKDPKGEVKDFIFTKFTLKDLKDPNVAIPMAVRWLFRKKRLAQGKLGREPSPEEIILEYKGLLKSTSKYKDNALKKFRELYALLKK
jgi:hypothetical protein